MFSGISESLSKSARHSQIYDYSQNVICKRTKTLVVGSAGARAQKLETLRLIPDNIPPATVSSRQDIDD